MDKNGTFLSQRSLANMVHLDLRQDKDQVSLEAPQFKKTWQRRLSDEYKVKVWRDEVLAHDQTLR